MIIDPASFAAGVAVTITVFAIAMLIFSRNVETHVLWTWSEG